jgi:hypothetical protein
VADPSLEARQLSAGDVNRPTSPASTAGCAEDVERYQWALRHYAAALRRGYWSIGDDDGRR